MNELHCNQVILDGIIKSITVGKSGYYLLNILTYKFNNDKYKNVYVSISISNDLYQTYKDLLFKDNQVFFKGYLNSYKTKDNKYTTIISITDIFENYEDLIKGKSSPHIRYDPDGVMVWNGKRCESTLPTKEELKEMEDLLSEYKWFICKKRKDLRLVYEKLLLKY